MTRRFEMLLDNQFVNTALIVDEAPVPIVQYSIKNLLSSGKVMDLGTHSLEELGYSVEGYAGWLRKIGYVEVGFNTDKTISLETESHYPQIGCTYDE